MPFYIGIDVGTSSTKGVLVTQTGHVVETVAVTHDVSRPAPGFVEMDAAVWWREFMEISHQLVAKAPEPVAAVGVSGMGPCVLLADDQGTPVRPAILYGVDTRAVQQIAELNERLGASTIFERCGSMLSTQAVGPKLMWLAEHEPEAFARARRLFMPASWLAWKLTESYVLDHQSASQATPMYDAGAMGWYQPWVDEIAGDIQLPDLRWASEEAGRVTPQAALDTGLPEGIPVTVGTIDAWSEAISVDAHSVGDLMLMYGTTMFMINTVAEPLSHPALWGTVGALPNTRNLAGGMATSGAITGWLRELFGSPDYPTLLLEADRSGPGAKGLLMLPYFAGERTPVADPAARGLIAGLTISHTRGDVYRAALEATAMGVRHNIEAFREAGGAIERVVAVGGGTQGGLWAQIVTDVTGIEQVIPTTTVGASYGSAWLAACLDGPRQMRDWNPPAATLTPVKAHRANYDELYAAYRATYLATADISHLLAKRQALLS